MTNEYTTDQLRIIRILAYITLTLLYIECRFIIKLQPAFKTDDHILWIKCRMKTGPFGDLYAKYYKFHQWVLLSFRALKTSNIETPFWCNKVILGCCNKLVTCALKMWLEFILICYIVARDCVKLLHWWSFVYPA